MGAADVETKVTAGKPSEHGLANESETQHAQVQVDKDPAGPSPGPSHEGAISLASEYASRSSPELVIGIVGAVGADLSGVADEIKSVLHHEVNYHAETIRLARLLHSIQNLYSFSPNATEEVRYTEYMKAGTELRKRLNGGDAMSQLAVFTIPAVREEMLKSDALHLRRAFILHSLKRKEEVDTLRSIYGASFFLVAAYSPRPRRVQDLATRIATSHYQAKVRDFRKDAEELIAKDENERDEPLGQNVEKTFPEADVFVDTMDRERMRLDIQRFIRLIFGYPFHTPTRDEQGTFLAKSAALRSSALGRQVGSAITNSEGDVLVVGTNEVPKASGGMYWEGDHPDGRDFKRRLDISDRHKRDVLGDALSRLKAKGWLAAPYNAMDVPELVQKALGKDTQAPLRGSRMMDNIEFVRTVHAEMAALMEAARRGIAVNKQTMYVTTFPCHECARHVIAVGISRVVYIDPYPKSLAAELYDDSMIVEGTGHEQGPVRFEPFIGIAPRRYFEFFEMRGDRKNPDGSIITWEPDKSVPRFPGNFASYLQAEDKVTKEFVKKLAAADLSIEN